jgi:secondary thiamine-phosphate synthase enzyme
MVYGRKITVETKGFSDIKDITSQVREVTSESKIKEGLANIFVIGSTASVSTIEYEPELVEDVREKLEEFVSSKKHTRHSAAWGDDNGFSHIRATVMGPGISVPVSEARLVLGTWQQIVVIDHDNRPRLRELFVQVLGD